MGKSSGPSSSVVLVPVKKNTLSKKDAKLKSIQARQDAHKPKMKAIPMKNLSSKNSDEDGESDRDVDNNRNYERREDKTEWKNFKKHGLGTMNAAELTAYQKMSMALKTAVRKACHH